MKHARIRLATAADGPVLRAIEREAGERFRDVGLGYVADYEPMSLEDLTRHAADGRSWVALADDDNDSDDDSDSVSDEPVGYVVADVVDGHGHIAQITVRPDHQGRGLARVLIEHVERWAADRGMSALTLTTFSDVPWNRPLYEHLGFSVMDEDAIGPELQTVRADEAAIGLDPATRVCMLRPVR